MTVIFPELFSAVKGSEANLKEAADLIRINYIMAATKPLCKAN